MSLMDTHHHAVVETAEPNLGHGMQRALGGYAHSFNARHGREGHLFHGPFWSRRLYGDGHFLTACLYAVLNPVAAGICAHPREWPWCSYREIAAGRGSERLMGLLGDDASEALATYVDVVDEAACAIRERRAADARELLSLAREAVRGELQGSG